MNIFERMRNQIRTYISAHETWLGRIWHGGLTWISLLVINSQFGYAKVLTNPIIAIVIALFCAFVPASASTFIIVLYLLVQLMSLSYGVAFATLLLFAISYAICSIYHSKRVDYLAGLPVCYQLHIPFILPLESALLGTINEICAVICGGVLSYFLTAVHENSAVILDTEATLSASDLLLQELIANPMFYLYMISIILLFLVVYVLRCRDMDHAWLIAVVMGVLVEFVIMLAASLFLGNVTGIPILIISNIVILLTGIIITYIFRDLDYTRVEKVQFEDDDYYYYVTAIPKIKLTKEEEEIKTITKNFSEKGDDK